MMKNQMDQSYANFLTATEALAENLAHSEPIAAYQNAHHRLDLDHQAQTLLQQLGQLQSQIRAAQLEARVTQADIERLRSLQREAQSNPSINEFAATQEAAVAHLREINMGKYFSP